MNDGNFIIISSDEETSTNSPSKTEEDSNITKGSVEPTVHESDGSKNKHSLLGSSNQEKLQRSQTVTNGIKNLSSKNSDCYISKESLDDIQELNHPQYCTKETKNKTEAELDSKKNNKTDNNLEMSDTFNKFLQLVLSMEEKECDKARLLKKITKYHNLADPNYLRSDEFKNLLENSMQKLVKDQTFLYFIIKDVLDCLLSKRIIIECHKQQNLKSSDTGEKDSKEENYEEDLQKEEVIILSERDVKNYKTVKKLSKALRKLEKKIKELEDTEVDLSDEEDSVYLKMQRFRERYCQIHKKLCAYTKQTATTKRAYTRKITFNGTKNLRLDRAIETWLNKTMQFPDYASVLKFLQESNDDLLKMSEEELKKLAIDVFVKIGNSLQLRRKYDLWDSLNSFLDNKVDPSLSDADLKGRLDSNFEVAARKEKEILNYYADLQVKRSLEPVEVPDEEANESPVESGDEDENELEAVENELSSKIPGEVYDKIEESGAEESDREDSNSPLASDKEAADVESKQSDASLKPECIPNCSDKHKGSSEDNTKSIVCVSLTNAMQKSSERNIVKSESEMQPVKNLWETENRKCVKKAKLTKAGSCDDNSDCELITLLSDEDTNLNFENDDNFKMRKTHQINYAFINNNFNHNATLTADDIVIKRKNIAFSYKSGKTPRRSLSIPLSDLTNVKHITNKYSRCRGGLEKRKFQESIRLHPFERSRFRYSQFILPGKITNNHCALRNESGGENVKTQNGSDQLNEKDSCEETSNDQRINPPNGGASGGGNGEDNNEDDGKKKPSDKEKRSDGSQATEDEDDNEQEEEEMAGSSRSESNSTAAESNGTDPEASQRGTGNDQIPKKSNPVSNSPQLQNIGMDPPQSKHKSVAAKAKKIPSNGIKVHKNRGVIPSTSRFAAVKYPFGYKPCVGAVKTARNRPKQSGTLNSSQVESINPNQKKQPTSAKVAKTDEEIVNNFLQHSPSSISITSPRKRITEKKPSQSVLQAMQTLSRLKGITTTVVRGSCSEKQEDIIIVEESPSNVVRRNNKPQTPKSRRNQSFLLPKIVTVQGNVTDFDIMESDNATTNFPEDKGSGSKRRRLRGTPLPKPTGISDNSENQRQMKSTEQPAKNVEYVVLE